MLGRKAFAQVLALTFLLIGAAAGARPSTRLLGRRSAREPAAPWWAFKAGVGSVSREPHTSLRDEAVWTQRDFCLSDRGLFLDTEANFVRYPVNFLGLSFSIFCHQHQDLVSNGIFDTGAWEEEMSKSMLGTMQQACLQLKIPLEEAIFLDIGANIGWYTLLFAAAGHSVIAFEPLLANEQLLRRSLCSNAGFQERVTYYTDMLSDAPHKNCTLFAGMDNLGDGTVSCNQHFLAPDNYTIQGTGLHMTTVDTALADVPNPIVMVKMDVEGHEGHVFRGASASIIEARVPYIMFEFEYAWIEQSGGHPLALLTRLVDSGYKLSFESFQGMTFDPLVYYADPVLPLDVIRNIFCVHERMFQF